MQGCRLRLGHHGLYILQFIHMSTVMLRGRKGCGGHIRYRTLLQCKQSSRVVLYVCECYRVVSKDIGRHTPTHKKDQSVRVVYVSGV